MKTEWVIQLVFLIANIWLLGDTIFLKSRTFTPAQADLEIFLLTMVMGVIGVLTAIYLIFKVFLTSKNSLKNNEKFLAGKKFLFICLANIALPIIIFLLLFN